VVTVLSLNPSVYLYIRLNYLPTTLARNILKCLGIRHSADVRDLDAQRCNSQPLCAYPETGETAKTSTNPLWQNRLSDQSDKETVR
jgi:hypothetical protein